MTNVKPATDEQVERWRAVLNHRPCSDPNACDWCQLLARIDADREEPRALRQAIGMLTTLHPTMVMDPLNPVGMALQVHAHVTQEIAALKAEVERLTPAFLPCHVCGGKGISDIIHGAVVRCENCDGTGMAR